MVLFYTCSACVAEECAFNKNLFLEKMYSENKAIVSHTWSEKQKEVKGVLKNGNIFTVKHWSCNHYGTHAIMIVGPYSATIPEVLNKDFLSLANIALQKDEVTLLKHYLDNKKIKLLPEPQKFTVPSEQFSEFYISSAVANELIIMEIKLYKD